MCKKGMENHNKLHKGKLSSDITVYDLVALQDHKIVFFLNDVAVVCVHPMHILVVS